MTSGLMQLALDVQAPHLEYGLLAPLLVVLVGALIGVLVEAFVPRAYRHTSQTALSGLVLLIAFISVVHTWSAGTRQVAALNAVVVDGPSVAAWAALLVFGALGVVLFAERTVNAGQSAFAPMASAMPGTALEREAQAARMEHTEVFPLLLFALFGMMLFASSDDLLTMFVALEIFSLPLYLLTGMARRRRLLSQEGALKYFLLGSLSSALFLYGSTLLYGYSGSFRLADIDTAISAGQQSNTLLVAGLGLVTIGLLFKIGAVPFHSWTPDAYVGAPTPVTGFMAICTKLAATVALLRVLYAGLGAVRWDWQPLIAIIAILTMFVGAVVAISQNDVKRMLAYSSIAHAGFVLTAVTGAVTLSNGLSKGQVGSTGAILFYLIAYGFATIGAFGLLMTVRKSGGEITAMSAWRGIGRTHPVVAGLMTLFLLSFAGIPLTGGFVGKLVVFVAAWRGGYSWLVAVAIVASIVAAFFYLRLVVLMFFQDPVDDEVEVVKPAVATSIAIGLSALATLVLGLYSGPLLRILGEAAQFLR